MRNQALTAAPSKVRLQGALSVAWSATPNEPALQYSREHTGVHTLLGVQNPGESARQGAT